MKSIQVQLTTKCNQKCVMCRKYTWKQKELALDKLMNVLDKYKGATVTFSGGDPLEYSHLPALLHYLIKNKVVYQVFTNLTYILNQTQLSFLRYAKWIQVSLDGGNSKTYKNIRGANANFGLLVNNAAIFSQNLKFNCTVSKYNSCEVESIAHTAYMLSAPVRFWPVHTHDNMKLDNDCIALIQKSITNLKVNAESIYNNTNLKDFTDLLNRKAADKCYVKTQHRLIDEDGIEYPCCRAINDNGKDWGGRFSCEHLGALEDPDATYEFCVDCDRYVRFNQNWGEYKERKELFL